MDNYRVAKGAVAGAIGGLAGTWAMNQFQAWWSRAIDGRESGSAAGRHDARDWQEQEEGQNANEIAAQTVAAHTVDRPLTRDELSAGATAIHFAFGTTMGALYGAFWEVSPNTREVGGAAFGTAVWAAADEVAMPMLGLSGPTTQRSAGKHAHSFASHIVYGMTTEVVRRGVRAMLNGGRHRAA